MGVGKGASGRGVPGAMEFDVLLAVLNALEIATLAVLLGGVKLNKATRIKGYSARAAILMFVARAVGAAHMVFYDKAGMDKLWIVFNIVGASMRRVNHKGMSSVLQVALNAFLGNSYLQGYILHTARCVLPLVVLFHTAGDSIRVLALRPPLAPDVSDLTLVSMAKQKRIKWPPEDTVRRAKPSKDGSSSDTSRRRTPAKPPMAIPPSDAQLDGNNLVGLIFAAGASFAALLAVCIYGLGMTPAYEEGLNIATAVLYAIEVLPMVTMARLDYDRLSTGMKSALVMRGLWSALYIGLLAYRDAIVPRTVVEVASIASHAVVALLILPFILRALSERRWTIALLTPVFATGIYVGKAEIWSVVAAWGYVAVVAFSALMASTPGLAFGALFFLVVSSSHRLPMP